VLVLGFGQIDPIFYAMLVNVMPSSLPQRFALELDLLL